MKSVRNAVNALRCFGPNTPELAVSDISRRLGLPRSSASRLLGALRDGGLLDQDPTTRRYKPGNLALVLGGLHQATTRIMDQVDEALADLVRRTGHTGYIAVLDGPNAVVLRNRQGSYPVRFVVEPGTRIPACVTGVGKALLARLPDDALRALYRGLRQERDGPGKVRWALPTVDALLADLARVRTRGWALADQDTFPGIRAIAVAVGGGRGEKDLGVSLSYPVAGVSNAEEVAMRRLLLAAVRRVGQSVGDPFWGPRCAVSMA